MSEYSKKSREKSLWELISKVKNNTNISKIKKITLNEIAGFFHPDRCFIIEYDEKQTLLPLDECSEYLISTENKSMVGVDLNKKYGFKYWVNLFIERYSEQKQTIIYIPDFQKYIEENSLEKSKIDEYRKKFKLKSGIVFSIFEKNKIKMSFVINFSEERTISDEDISFINTYLEQVYIAINQSTIIKQLEQKAEKERILTNTTNIIRSSLETKTIIHNLVFELGKFLGASRSFFSKYDPISNSFLTPDESSEYLASENIKSYRTFGENLQTAYPFLSDLLKNIPKIVIMKDRENFIKKYHLENTSDAKNLRNYNVGSTIIVPIIYQKKLLGGYVFDYEKPDSFNQEAVDFVISISEQTAIAIYQAALFEKVKKQAANESILRKITTVISSTLDIKKIEKYITKTIGKALNFDRCFIIKYDEGNDFLANVNEFSEYLSSPELKSTIGFSFSGEGMDVFKNAEEIFENDVNAISEDFSDGLRKYLKDFSIASGFQIRLSYGNKYLGVLAAHSTSSRPPFSNEEKNFIRIIARQTGIAIYQSKLYEQERRIKEREKLSRKIIETIRSSLDEEETLEIICTEVAKLFNVQKVAIIEFPDISNFQNWILRKEYKSKNNEDDINNSYLQYLGEIALERGEQLVISNISNANINEHFKNLYNAAGIKSILSLPIQQKEKKFGIIYLATTDYEKNWSYDEIDFLEIISDQIYVAITQAELYSTAKRQAEVQNAILNNIPFMAWLKDREGRFIATNKNFCQNYKLKLSDIIGKTDFDITPYELAKRYAEDDKEVMRTGKTLTREEIILTESGIGWSETIKSPLYDENKNIIGTTGVAKDITERKKYEKELLRRQVLILRQSRREMLLRNVINTIRSSIEIDKIKKNIVNEVGRVFNADRCFLREYDIKNDRFLKPEVEYLSSPSIQSILDIEPDQEGLKYFFEQAHGKDKNTPIEISEETLKQKNIEHTALNRYFKNSQIKTDLAIPVWGKTGELTFLALHYIKRSIPLSKEDKELLITLSKQISIALEQSELYSEVKVQAERERIRGKVVEIIRSSLNLKVVLKSICEELLSLFDVQRIFIGKLDFTAKQNFIEIVKGNKTLEVSSTEYFNSIAKYWENRIKTQKTKKIVNNIEESDIPDDIKENYRNLNIKSIIAIPIKSHDEIWGGLFLSTVNQTKEWKNSEISFLESIVNQLDTAIRQAELYEFQKKIAKKESALREIISEIKLTRDLNQAYNKLLEKLTEIFKLNRALFLESSSIDPDELSIKYEYVIDREDLKVNHLIFPPVCVEKFLNLIHNLEPLVIDDVFSCHPASALEFFKKYKMNALMAVPLVKYNRETKVLGFIVLCSEEKRQWETEEIELINAISESVVSVIWEISKFIEIEDLRNSFVLTLAHDFQVPLIGEKLAIEFLLKEESITMGNSKEILNEILENNRNIINMLNKSVDIYNYEAGKKVLNLENYRVSYILEQAVSTLKRKAQLKKVKINMKKSKQDILINVDKTEILKALDTVIQNAIDHSPEGETVEINYYKKFNRILISIHNNGPEIPPATQEIIFKRYEMALAIERKIGAGTGLFLSQKIINAHKGSIWFETSKRNGTYFFISLPFV